LPLSGGTVAYCTAPGFRHAPDRYLQTQRNLQPVHRDGFQPGDGDTHDAPEEEFVRVFGFLRQVVHSNDFVKFQKNYDSDIPIKFNHLFENNLDID
jgi:hypothetical protein